MSRATQTWIIVGTLVAIAMAVWGVPRAREIYEAAYPYSKGHPYYETWEECAKTHSRFDEGVMRFCMRYMRNLGRY